MRTFKFLRKPNDYTVNVLDITMFKVYTFDEVYQSDVDKWTELCEPYMFLPNTEENRNQIMNVLAPYFFKIESIYTEPA